MNKSYTLFIGSDNSSHLLEKDKIKSIVSIHHDGFTMYEATGSWRGTEEQTAVVEITTDKDISTTIQQLKAELHQESIAYRETSTLSFA